MTQSASTFSSSTCSGHGRSGRLVRAGQVAPLQVVRGDAEDAPFKSNEVIFAADDPGQQGVAVLVIKAIDRGPLPGRLEAVQRPGIEVLGQRTDGCGTLCDPYASCGRDLDFSDRFAAHRRHPVASTPLPPDGLFAVIWGLSVAAPAICRFGSLARPCIGGGRKCRWICF
jgi:hypothetical protein